MTGQLNVNINLGFDKLFEMVASYLGPGIIRRKSVEENKARLSAAHTDIDVQKLGVTAEYEEKKARLLAERDYRQFEAQLRAKELPPAVDVEIIDDVPIIWDPEPVVLDHQRRPFEFVEQRRLRNLQQVVNETANNLKALPAHEEVSEQGPDPDWAARFFDCAQDVSNEDMQKLWGKLLAGEIAQPGKYSLRTLDVLRNLTSTEAQLFHRYITFCSNIGQILLPDDEEFVKACSVRLSDTAQLVECGLLHPGKEAMFGFQPVDVRFPFRAKVLRIHGPTTRKLWGGTVFDVTGAGRDLANISLPPVDETYLAALRASALRHKLASEVTDASPPTPEPSEQQGKSSS
ncbi:DUF2806 domain-containing protein [Polyangium spumosum]|uniref:DUF2806 domain-containing protein n=1 Tax=Polyangium spumosum TaxID=889282 RepID=A0A6N7Q3K7_9BACT|nr:DUF2806 domain-containing protein [Polyangium spumosum]MRG98609.1 DUF2806 domain-containing protein [Polyangium spumosum]